MGFRQADSEGRGGWLRVWKIKPMERHSVCQVSSSKKVKETADTEEHYETDFQDGFVRFIGSAHEKIRDAEIPKKGGLAIQVTSCEVTRVYDAEKDTNYTNFLVYAFDFADEDDKPKKKTAKKTTKKSAAKAKPKKEEEEVEEDEEEEDLPF